MLASGKNRNTQVVDDFDSEDLASKGSEPPVFGKQGAVIEKETLKKARNSVRSSKSGIFILKKAVSPRNGRSMKGTSRKGYVPPR